MLKRKSLLFVFLLLSLFWSGCSVDKTPGYSGEYLQNRPPLIQKPYLQLPLGSIHPEGWMLEQLSQMRKGLTGHLDEEYAHVIGHRNGWLGGDGDGCTG